MHPATPTTIPPPERASTSKVGATLDGRYRLEALIGEGGVGQVYRATHLTLGRPVAVKLLLQEHEISDVAKARFTREAKTLAALRHPNIVTVIDFGFSDVPFLVLELVQGCELEELVAQGPLAIDDALSVAKQLLAALAYAHEAGVIHRDLKPSNLFVRRLPSGLHVEVLDFGLAKFLGDGEDDTGGDIKVTRAGNIVGTPAYMSPEQVTGDAIDERADQYAAGIVLFEMLTGHLPFDFPEVTGLLRAQLITPAPKLAELAPKTRFSAALEALVARALAKDPDERFADISEMLAAIDVLPELGGASHGEDSGVLETAKRLVGELGSAIAKGVEPNEPDEGEQGRSLPAPPKALIIGTSIAFVLAVGVWLSRDDAPAPTEPQVAPVEVVESVEPPTDEVVDDDHDPWTEVPRELAEYKRRLDDGRRLRRRQIGSLRAYASNHPGDPRPLLLHGRAYVNQGWLSHALPLFIEAYEAHPSARNDPEMLNALVRMARSEPLETDAANAIRRIYGEEARPALRKAIGEERERVRLARLQRLLISLE